MNDFKLLCCESGICDFLYIKRNRSNRIINDKAPAWMNKIEANYWKIGYAYAREQCRML